MTVAPLMAGAIDERFRRRYVLAAFGQAIDRETHNLSAWPAVLWQQLYNRLQWVDETRELIDQERQRKTIPWIRTQTPFAESRGLLRTLPGHIGAVRDSVVAPDGSYVVSASDDGTLKLWNPRTGEELRTLTGHPDSEVKACAVSPDGEYLVSGASDKTLKIWAPRSGDMVGTLQGHADEVRDCAVSPDGAYIVSASGDGTLKVWARRDGRELHTLRGHSGAVQACAVSPDGTYVVSASSDRTLRTWNTTTGEHLKTLKGHDRDFEGLRGAAFVNVRPGVLCCVVSPDGRYIVSAGGDRSVRMWNPSNGKGIRTMTGHAGWVWDCAVSPDGRSIISADTEGEIRMWDAETGRLLKTLLGHGGMISGCAFSPDGAYVVSAGGWDHTLKMWDSEQAAAGQDTRQGHESDVLSTRVSPDGSFVVTAGDDGRIKIWDPSTGTVLRTLEGHDPAPGGEGDIARRAWDCAVSPDGNIVSVGQDGTLRVWDPDSGRGRVVARHAGGIQTFGCAVAPDGSFVVTAANDIAADLRIWDPQSWRELGGFRVHKKPVNHCEVSPDGAYVVSSGSDETLVVSDLRGRRKPRTLTGHKDSVRSCAISPDGAYVVSASADETLIIWDLKGRRKPRILSGHDGLVYDCAVSADARYVISIGRDGTLRLWNASSGLPVMMIALPNGPTSVAVLPSGDAIVVGDKGGRLQRMEIVGLELGPLITSAHEGDEGLTVHCARCRVQHRIAEEQLGQDLACSACGRTLRLRPFALRVQAWQPVKRRLFGR